MTKSGKHCGKRRNCLFELSAAEASESVYMRERVKQIPTYKESTAEDDENKKSNFFFCHTVFKSLLLQMHQNVSAVGICLIDFV